MRLLGGDEDEHLDDTQEQLHIMFASGLPSSLLATCNPEDFSNDERLTRHD
ncbi:hypothetical protein V3481_002017 [Fusarium oxysporum f. sp. vasinfectum]